MSKSLKSSYIVAVFILVNILLLSAIRFFPYPEIFAYPYLRNLGLLPYKDIIDQHFPGLFFLPINFASLGITSIERARILQFALISLNHLLLYRYFRNKNSAYDYRYLWANALYTIWSVVLDDHILWIDSIVTTLILASLVILQGKLRNIYIAFFLMGITVLFKQTALIFPLTTLFLWSNKYRVRELVYFLLIASVPLVFTIMYLSNIGVLEEFLFWTINFNREIYTSLAQKTPSTYQLIIISPIVISSLYVVVNNVILRKNLVISIFFAISILFAYPRFELIHVALSMTLGIVIIVEYFAKFKHFHIFGFLLFLTGISICLRNYQFLKTSTPVIDEELIQVIDELSDNGETIYAYSIDPNIFKLTNTTPVKPYFIHLPWYLVVLEDQMVTSLMNTRPRVIVRDVAASLDGRLIGKKTTSIDKYVKENYQVVYTNGSIEILTKNE